MICSYRNSYFIPFFGLDPMSFEVGDDIFVKLHRWSEYDITSPYPMENGHYVFRGIINKINKTKKEYSIHYPVFDGYDTVKFPEFFNTYCVTSIKNYEIIDQLMYKEYELTEESSSEIISPISEDDSSDNGLQEELTLEGLDKETEDIDDEDSSTDDDFHTGKGDDVSTKVFDSRGTGRPTINRFRSHSAVEILLYYLDPMIAVVLTHTNRNIEEANAANRLTIPTITKGEMVVYVSCLIFSTIVRLQSMHLHWYPDGISTYAPPLLSKKMTYNRYKTIRRYLRFANYGEDHDKNDKAWKIRPLFNVFQERVKGMQTAPSQKLSIDEAMGLCTSKTCPIRRIQPNKPISVGFQFFVLVEYSTKVILNINLDDGQITSENSKDYPYGVSGRRVMDLITCLPGRNYIVYTDNYYTSVPLCRALMDRNMYLIGTLRKNRGVIPDIKFPGKHPKPSRNNPRGSLKYAVSSDNSMFMYAFMDNGASYFLDSVYGPHAPIPMTRRVGNEVQSFEVPKAIEDYNKHMGGVDQSDQMRNGTFGIEMEGRTDKWTIKFFEVLLSFSLTNAYVVYRALHGNELSRGEFTNQVFEELFNNNLDQNGPIMTNRGAPMQQSDHVTMMFPAGSRQGNISPHDRRRRELSCAFCPKAKNSLHRYRRTSTFCSSCKISLHDACSLEYHQLLPTLRPEDRLKENPKVVEYIDNILSN